MVGLHWGGRTYVFRATNRGLMLGVHSLEELVQHFVIKTFAGRAPTVDP